MSVITIIIIIIIRGGNTVLFNYHEYYVLQNNRSGVGGSVFNALSCVCGVKEILVWAVPHYNELSQTVREQSIGY